MINLRSLDKKGGSLNKWKLLKPSGPYFIPEIFTLKLMTVALARECRSRRKKAKRSLAEMSKILNISPFRLWLMELGHTPIPLYMIAEMSDVYDRNSELMWFVNLVSCDANILRGRLPNLAKQKLETLTAWTAIIYAPLALALAFSCEGP